jgi:hypothetical protein
MIRLTTLLLEVSIDQLKTQFVDTGKISDSEFTEIVDAAGGKSAYATWLTKQVVSKNIKPEDLYKYNTYFKIFDRRKREYPFQDINQYKTTNDISQFISKSVEIADREKADPSQQRGIARSDKYKEFFIGSVDGFDVYELPKGRKDLYGASCELGSGTEWCTATGNTRNHFDNYISDGPLFIFTKPGSTEKYQFSYESAQFMDKDDNSVVKNASKTIVKLFRFIESKYPQYRMPLALKLLLFPDTITKDDLNVGDNLDLSDTQIQSLPAGLQVRGSLLLSGTQIQSLPADLQVGGGLDLRDTPIQSLPAGLQVGGNLLLSGTQIQSLPAGLRVGGSLDLSGTQIQSLPAGLRVGGSLLLSGTPISKKYTESEIRKMVTVKRNIFL